MFTTYKGGAQLEKNRIGIIRLPLRDLLPIEYIYKPPRKLVLRIRISLGYVGLYPTSWYTCYCGGGISKIIIFAKNPFKQLNELANAMINTQMLFTTIQLLTSLLSTIY
jgi:hypothetical protein